VEGNQLTQHINFDEHSIFPIVADPDWVKITLCAGALGLLVGSAVVVPAKLLKIKRYIQALGGLREAATLIVGATTFAEKMQRGGQALIALCEEIIGIGAVKDNCF
jgi:hypothetical protein